MPLASAALVLLLFLAGCGAASDEPAAPSPAEPAPQPASELQVTFWPLGTAAGDPVVASLSCDPPGGTHPDPEAACGVLAANAASLEPPPPDAVCTQIFGGPEEAEVTGTFQGRELHARFSRQNGCEIARWDALEPLLRLERT